LDDKWFSGAVIENEVQSANRVKWFVGKCSTDGSLTWDEGVLSGHVGEFTSTGPRCSISQSYEHSYACLNADAFNPQVSQCSLGWETLFSFGRHPENIEEGRPKSGSIFNTMPEYLVRGDIIEKNYCIGIDYDDEGEEVLFFNPCGHFSEILDFYFVPFIVEEADEYHDPINEEL